MSMSSYILDHCFTRFIAQMTININSKQNFGWKNLWTACYIGITYNSLPMAFITTVYHIDLLQFIEYNNGYEAKDAN